MSTGERHVFVSYSHADAAWVDRLRVHVRPLVRRGMLDVWDDSRIHPGQPWREEIAAALTRADVAILMVSADFLASDFIVNNELPPLLHRAAKGGVLVVPLIVGPCLFAEHEELSRYQSANRPDRPLTVLSVADAESVLVSLARSVDRYFHQLDATLNSLAGTPAPDAPAVGSDDDVTQAPALRARHVRLSEGPLVVRRPLNLGFDSSAPNGMPVGWFNSFGHVSGVSTDYDIRILPRSAQRMDGMCVVLERAAARPREFGSLMQRCGGRFLAGRTVRFEGELRTDAVSGWAGLWLRADSDARPNLFFDNMSRRPVVGTTAWARYFIDAPLPADTEWLNYGIVLSGSGALYADNLRLLVWTADDTWQDV